MERVQGKKENPCLVCEGPVEPSHTSSGHSSMLKHTTATITATTTTTTLDFKMIDVVKVNSHTDSG